MSNVFLGAGCPRGRLNYVINMTESVQYRIFDTTSTCFAIFRRNPLHLDWNLHDCDVLFKVSHFWVCSRWATSSFVQGEPFLVLFKLSHFWFCSRWATFGFVQGEPLLVSSWRKQLSNTQTIPNIKHLPQNQITKGPSYTFRPFNIRPLRSLDTSGTKHPVT